MWKVIFSFSLSFSLHSKINARGFHDCFLIFSLDKDLQYLENDCT